MSSPKKSAKPIQQPPKASEIKNTKQETIANPEINKPKLIQNIQVKSETPAKNILPIPKETEAIPKSPGNIKRLNSLTSADSQIPKSPRNIKGPNSLTSADSQIIKSPGNIKGPNSLTSADSQNIKNAIPTKSPSPAKSLNNSFSIKAETPLKKKERMSIDLNSIQEISASPGVNFKSIHKDTTFYKPKKKKEKESFTNEEIENKIKSRRRVLDILDDQTSNISHDILIQIESRDHAIDELTKELIALRSQVKETKSVKDAEENIKAKLLQQRVAELEHEKLIQEHRISELEEKDLLNNQNFEDEKNQFDLLQESLCEEIELLKTQFKNKSEENSGMLDDIKKLSEIVQQFKELNNELNKKIDKQNADFEGFKIKYYENEVKAANIEDLEHTIEEYARLYKKSENRANEKTEELRRMNIVFDDFNAFCKYIEDLLIEELTNIDNTIPLYQRIEQIKNEIGKRKLPNFYVSEPIPENEKDEKIRNLNEKLEKAFRDHKVLENSQKPLLEQISGMKELIEYIKGEHQNSIFHLNQTMKTIQDLNESFKTEIQSLRLEVSKKEVKIVSISSKLIAAENKEAKFEERVKKIIESRTHIEKEFADYKAKQNPIAAQLKEKQSELAALQKQNSKYLINIQTMHEEF